MYPILFVVQGESLNIDECLESVECRTPFIAVFGVNMDSLTDFKLVIERDTIMSVSPLSTALHCCFASYYIYNIVYPSPLKSFMLFF